MVAVDWLRELFGLPEGWGGVLTTGATTANFTGLAAARRWWGLRHGHDVDSDGLAGLPPVPVFSSGYVHASALKALAMLGIGRGSVRVCARDEPGRLDEAALERGLEALGGAPAIVIANAGEVNAGDFDPIDRMADLAEQYDSWLHVDGAFGLFARITPRAAPLAAGVERAHSVIADGHKWLNVPYDCGFAFCAHPDVHAAAMSYTAAYLTGQGGAGLRAPSDYVLESSRRARAFATWAALRQLGRTGVADLVERCCALARRFADQLAALDGVSIANEVVLNQVLVGFGDDARTDRVVERVQRSGECWMGATTWHGQRLMRISVSNWATTEGDVDRSVAAIRAAVD